MTPRYAEGRGKAPLHLFAIRHHADGKGVLVFVDRGGGEKPIAFSSDAQRIEMLRSLLIRAVPLLGGGNGAVPTDEVEFLVMTGKLRGPYVEFTWLSPERWMVREIAENAGPWEKVSDPALVANAWFDPQTLLGGR